MPKAMTTARPNILRAGAWRKNRPKKDMPTSAAKAKEAPRNAMSWLALFIASTALRSSSPVAPCCMRVCIWVASPPEAHNTPTPAASAMKVKTMQPSMTTWAAGCMVWKALRMKLMGRG